jgi:hypothetical protein
VRIVLTLLSQLLLLQRRLKAVCRHAQPLPGRGEEMCANLTQSLRQLHFKLLKQACRELRAVTAAVDRAEREADMQMSAMLSDLSVPAVTDGADPGSRTMLDVVGAGGADHGPDASSTTEQRPDATRAAQSDDRGSGGGSEPEYEDGDDGDEMVSEEVSDLLYTILSELVLSSTAPYLADFLERETASRDAVVNAKLARDVESGCFDGLNAKEEAALAGVDFSAAAQALGEMDEGASWRAKLAALLHCKDAIFAVLEERAVASGTDCFLPVFMYTLARAKLRAPIAACALLRQLCPPQMMKGEAGFFCTTFEAAVNYQEMIAAEEAERAAEEHSEGDDDAGTVANAGNEPSDSAVSASDEAVHGPGNSVDVPVGASAPSPVNASAPAPETVSNAPEIVRANFAFEARRPGDLSFAEHASIEVLSKGEDGWWRGKLVGIGTEEEGTFPANYCT